MKAGWLAVGLGFGLLAGCLGNDRVVRVVDGHEVEGRYIDAEAYDAFIRGTIAEADGQLDVAAAWYARAWEFDPAGVEPLARLGGVLCARNPRERSHADKVFAKAIEVGPTYGITYARRARCELMRGEPVAAERDARQALLLDPDDGEATLALSDALLAAGDGDGAARVLDGWVVWSGGARMAWRAVAELAERRHDELRLHDALEHITVGDGPKATGVPDDRQDGRRALLEIDQALTRGEVHEARAAAVDARLTASSVAVRACAMARWTDAVREARRVLAADPADPDALAVLLAVPDGHGDGWPPPGRSAFGAEAGGRKLSPLAALVLADAIRRRVGGAASRSFLEQYGPVDTQGDPLGEALRRRLEQAP